MKRRKTAVAALLLVSMLLSQAGVVPAWAAQGEPTTVTTAAEPAFAPLGEGASVVYERHEAGYQVTLNRTAEDATMTISTVPGSERERTAEKARLYLRTGVALKAGATYRVGFTLTADQAQGYTLCLDGESENAYGAPQERSVKAGAADRARVFVTPEADGGELVLRLLVGKTGAAGNVLRLSDLTVEEASEAQVEAGTGKVLVDSLDYNAPGSITVWANDDSGAKLTPGEGSATLTVTQAPTGKVEVWKIKLLVHTGLNPEAGKTYRLKADVLSSVAADYEICYNEGDTEKGYDVLYNQKLTGKKQTLERSIYVPRDKESAGEIVLQLSLGKLPQGETVTISNIKVEEAATRYTNALRSDFAFDREDTENIYEIEKVVGGFHDITQPISWNGKGSVTITGDHKGSVDVEFDSVQAKFDGGSAVFHTRLNLFTGETLTKDTIYQVSFHIQSALDYSDNKYEILYGTGFKENGIDNNEVYGALKGRTLAAGDTGEDVIYFLRPEADGPLLVSLQLGAVNGGANTVIVSQLKIVEMQEGAEGEDIADVQYPSTKSGNQGNFTARDGKGTVSGNGTSATIVLVEKATSDTYPHGLFTGDVATFTDAGDYRVSFEIQADASFTFDVLCNKNDDWGEGQEGGFGGEYTKSVTANAGPVTFTHDFTAAANDKLRLRFDLGHAPKNTSVTVGNIKVQKKTSGDTLGADIASVNYPLSNGSDVVVPGSFQLRENSRGTLSSAPRTAAYTRDTNDTNTYECGLFVNKVCAVENALYAVSYKIKPEETPSPSRDFVIKYNHLADRKYEQDDGRMAHPIADAEYTDKVLTRGGGELFLLLEFENVSHEKYIQFSELKVKKINLTPKPSGTTNVTFSSISTDTPGNSENAGDHPYTATLTPGDSSVTVKFDKPDGTEAATWRAKLCVKTGVSYAEGKNYRVKFNIKATADDLSEFCVITKGLAGEPDIRGTWGLSLKKGVDTPITTRPIPAGMGSGGVDIDIELGKLNGSTNTFTVSNVQVEEVTFRNVERVIESKTAGTSECALQEGYRGKLDRAKDHATLNILETPAKGMEAWKSKLFVDTGVQANADETFRVTMDVTAEKDMDFEVCYNRGEAEKGFDAIYGLHAGAGTVKTVEKAFTAKYGGKIVIQLSLGNVPAANAVTVSNLRVEKATFTYSGKSALPEPLRFTAASAVSYWAHGDYSTSLTGSEDAITMNILKAPATGAEPWKIKLFLDTGAVLEAGKYYKVTTDLVAQKAQTAEICYNSGGAEAAYDAQRGIALAAGEKKRVEKLLSVPTTMTDASNLMLQVNLGGTDQPNAVTVSGITVEEVPVNYVDRAGQGMAYLPGQTVTVWNTDDYTTVLSENPDAAVLHVMEAPATGAEVWKVQLYVHTGAVLAPGKTYQVHANLTATRAQGYELCFNNEETEKGYDVLYGQQVPGGYPVSVDKQITVPADMTDAGELILQFSLGGPVRNDFLVSGVTVQELDFGESATQPGAPHTVVDLLRGQGAKDNTLDVTGERVAVHMAGGSYGALRMMGAGLRSADRYTVAFTAKADKPLAGEFAMMPQNGSEAVIYGQFDLSAEETAYAFTTPVPLAESGQYELRWLFAPEAAADVEISQVSVYVPAEELWVMPSQQAMTVNGRVVTPAAYAISGYNYVKLRDMALLLKGTQAQFVVRYNAQTNTVSITTGKEYTPIGGELAVGNDYSATCTRSVQSVTVNGKETKLKVFAIGGNNYFRIRDLAAVVGFGVDYDAATDTVVITSPLTPEKMEAAHDYQFFFRPEIDGESQPYVGDTMPFYEDGTYYIYYLKEGGDSYNHSVYLATTPDFVHYTEYDDPVLSASRADVQDSWIGTGSVVKAEGAYYFFYTGFNSSGSQEYHEKIMVAKGSTPTAFEKVAGWEIVPPAELNQKNDFRDPQAYYDSETGTISLTVTASQNGVAKILKYTVSPDLRSVSYDGPIFADPTGLFWNLECSDTFRMGDKWYLTYSAQEDTLWYASADSRFGPYSAPQRLEGKLFYAGKHVESETGSYMVGWVRRSNSASSTTEVNGWGGNMGVQRLLQKPDGSLTLAPVESVTAAFGTPKALAATEVSRAVGSFTPAFTCADSFLLKGQFTYTGTGSFGLAFDFNGNEEQYKLISLNPAEHKLSLSFQKGAVPISETQVELVTGQTYSFTYIQDGSIGTFYLDGQTALTVRLYGTTGKNICLFAENGGVTFTALEQFTR